MSDSETLRVIVADDHPVVRDGVRLALDGAGSIQVVGEAASGPEAVEVGLRLRPHVALIDLHMPGGDGITAIREMGRVCPSTRCLVLTMDDEDEALSSAIRAGARGYLVKGARKEAIIDAVRTVAGGGVVFGPDVAAHVVGAFEATRRPRGARAFPGLSDRELELLDLVALGLDNASIARRLGIAPKTVRNQLSLLLTKLGVADRASAMVVAREAGLGRDGRPS